MLDLSMNRANSLSALGSTARPVFAAGLAILPDAAKLIFRGRPAAVKKAGEAFGLTLPLEACRFSAEKTRTAFWLGPDEWMLQDIDAEASVLMGDLERALADEPHSLVDVSHRSDALAISGERSAYLLNHGCPLDLSLEAFPVGMCTRTIFAKAAILLSRPDRHTFHLDLWRSYAPYVWELLDEARSEFA